LSAWSGLKFLANRTLTSKFHTFTRQAWFWSKRIRVVFFPFFFSFLNLDNQIPFCFFKQIYSIIIASFYISFTFFFFFFLKIHFFSSLYVFIKQDAEKLSPSVSLIPSVLVIHHSPSMAGRDRWKRQRGIELSWAKREREEEELGAGCYANLAWWLTSMGWVGVDEADQAFERERWSGETRGPWVAIDRWDSDGKIE